MGTEKNKRIRFLQKLFLRLFYSFCNTMSDVCNNNDNSKDIFSALSFERKIVELIEELRLRRNLEIENESTVKSLMDEKYKEELIWEEQQRRYLREKEDLEQQICLLKRKLEDKVCVSDDDKAKQHVINRTYSHEIRMLKEELRTAKSEKLNLQKKIQELEGKLSLHNNFQESIMSQIADVRKTVKNILEDSQQLTTAQKNVMENVASAKASFRKFDMSNHHLQQSMTIIGRKSEVLKKELISCRSELTMLKNSQPLEREIPKNNQEIEKMEKKILELENLLLISRKENEKTLHNFLESNSLLCKFMDKYSETQDRERQLTKEIEELRENSNISAKKLQDALDELKRAEEEIMLKETQRIENQHSVGIQTECLDNNDNRNLKITDPPNADALTSMDLSLRSEDDFLEKIRHDLLGLQQTAVCGRSDFSLSGNLADKKITFSEVLKRKIEVMESGEEFELISMKRRFVENKVSDARVSNEQKNELLQLSDLSLAEIGFGEKSEEALTNLPNDHKYLKPLEELPQRVVEEKFEGENGQISK